MTKYYGQNCLKNFLFHSTSSIMIQISEHGPILAQNKNKSIKKTHKQVSFLISIFELKQTSTFVLTENCWIWNFSATHLLDIFIACLRKVLKLRNIEVWRRLRQGMDKKMFLRTILGKIFGKQCRKSKKKPRKFRHLLLNNFSDCYCQKKSLLERRLGTRLCPLSILRIT